MQTIVQDIGQSPDAAVIWLHGLGADGSDFVPAIPHLNLPQPLSVRFVFPSAPIRAVTINGGMHMPSWYDITQMLPKRSVCVKELTESVESVRELVTQLRDAGISEKRILLVGFSQGGALAYQCVLVEKMGIGAVAAMSTYLPQPDKVGKAVEGDAADVLILHGSEDEVVPVEMGKAALETLSSLGYTPAWHDFKMQHQVTADSLNVLGRWISNYLERE